MIDPKKLAASTLQLLQDDPRRYRNYGVYWYLIKAILKHYYTQDNLYLLGDYRDDRVVEMMPKHSDLQEALAAAIETYKTNASFNLNSSEVAAPDGGTFLLVDPDAGGI